MADLVVVGKPKGMVGGFRSFISDYGILPLAVGVVIGNAVNDLVKILVEGLIVPFINLLVPNGRLQGFQWKVNDSVFKIGSVLNATLTFLIIAWVIYLVAKFILHNEDLLKKK